MAAFQGQEVGDDKAHSHSFKTHTLHHGQRKAEVRASKLTENQRQLPIPAPSPAKSVLGARKKRLDLQHPKHSGQNSGPHLIYRKMWVIVAAMDVPIGISVHNRRGTEGSRQQYGSGG